MHDLLDGVSVKSCAVLAAQVDGGEVTTIEGLAAHGALTTVQNALWEEHSVQCGYCTPGDGAGADGPGGAAIRSRPNRRSGSRWTA